MALLTLPSFLDAFSVIDPIFREFIFVDGLCEWQQLLSPPYVISVLVWLSLDLRGESIL